MEVNKWNSILPLSLWVMQFLNQLVLLGSFQGYWKIIPLVLGGISIYVGWQYLGLTILWISFRFEAKRDLEAILRFQSGELTAEELAKKYHIVPPAGDEKDE